MKISNDLISRSAVISLIDELGYVNCRNSKDFEANSRVDKIRQGVVELPTAYEVDNVVELEKENAEMKEVIRKLLCSEYGSSCQFCIQDNNDNAICRKVGGSGSWCCENAAYDRDWNKRQVV